ncbi:hypothetical protein HD806DRAFT_37474 [Xylariaceae sp. AK1471]|nr:hypothetical protein HD806DRAFT_37474 [Xylariaceae sp. AK1471]
MTSAPLLAILGSHYWGTHHPELARSGLAWLRVFLVVPGPDQVLVPAPSSPATTAALLLLPTIHHYLPPVLLPHHTPSGVCLSVLRISLPLSRSPAPASVILADLCSIHSLLVPIRSSVSASTQSILLETLNQRSRSLYLLIVPSLVTNLRFLDHL